jgi:hypothetical protein
MATLSSDEVALILAQLDGDVPSLCAAACVSRAWRAAAAAPALWVRLECLPPAVAERLNAERLAGLVARAAGGLQLLDLSDAGRFSLTDADLVAALRQPHALTSFTADSGCERLTAAGVVAALASRRGLMFELSVAGLAVGPELPSDDDEDEEDGEAFIARQRAVNAFVTESDAVRAALRALLRPTETWTVSFCAMVQPARSASSCAAKTTPAAIATGSGALDMEARTLRSATHATGPFATIASRATFAKRAHWVLLPSDARAHG